VTDPVYISLEEAWLLCRKLGDLKIRDLGLLDSALHRPQASFGGTDAYPGIPQKAAALLHSLAKNHALLDGNKRLAWMCYLVFLASNGCRPAITHQEAIDLVLGVASGRLEDIAEIAILLNVVPVDPGPNV
jgi:death-on-curing protein